MGDKHYDYIRAWGILFNLPEINTERVLRLARQLKAPETALFHYKGTWVTFDELSSDKQKAKIMDIILAMNERSL